MIAQKKIPILIFDANIFLKGVDINIFEEKIYTTPKIIKEIEVLKYSNKNRNILTRIEVAIANKHLNVREPNQKYISRTIKESQVTGDIDSLSKADIELISLALEMKETLQEEVILYSNDYSVQNLSAKMKIQSLSMYKKGIIKQKIFELYCPSCRKTYDTKNSAGECESCGTKLRRRPK